MKKDADFPANGGETPFVHADNVFSFDPDLASIGPHQADQVFEQDALAAAAAADDRERLAVRDFKIDTAQNLLGADRASSVPAREIIEPIVHY